MQYAIQILSNPYMSSSLEGKTDIIIPKQSRQKQRVVIEFLLSEGETAQKISRRLKQVYGDGAIDYSRVSQTFLFYDSILKNKFLCDPYMCRLILR